jgi:hypothetical protein
VNRERLAAEQAALVRALVGGGPVPGGFDPERVRATSAALARKRAREVARAWPVLAAELGDDFTGRFLAFAAGRPRRPEGARWPTASPLPAPWPARAACPVTPGSSASWPGPTAPPARSAWPPPWPAHPAAW